MDALTLLNRAPGWMREAVTSVTRGQGALGALFDVVAHPVRSGTGPDLPDGPETEIRFLVGPANEAEQGYQWSRASERIAGVSAVSLMGMDAGGYGATADLRVPFDVYLRSREWHDRFEDYLLGRTHLLWESNLPLLGRRYGADARAEMVRFREAGLGVAMIFHGSDARPPDLHASQSEWSPFHDRQVVSRLLGDRVRANHATVRDLDVPVFVSTPDLLHWVPGATWCPIVVNSARWRVGARPVALTDRPVVVHAPSNPRLKGTDRIEPMLHSLDEQGVIRYRRIVDVPHEQMPATYADADIVLDQFLIGSYGATSCEALAAGRLVIAHVDESAREVVRDLAGVEVPIVQATVASLEGVLRGIVSCPEDYAEVVASGPRYVDAVHDGRRSAAALASFLENSPAKG